MDRVHFVFAGSGGMRLPAVIWAPEKPRAVLQVAHGMTEHMERYEAFASEMAARDIAVAGFDLRGHGRNAGMDRVTMKLIPGARHDILHDNAARVNMTRTVLTDWLEKQLASDFWEVSK